MRSKLLNSLRGLLVAAGLCLGASASWAATPTLTESYTVAGYNVIAYYNLAASNVNNMCPTSGDVCYRDSYGLFNFGSGNRSGNITISVSKDNLIIFEAKQSQTYDDKINSVSLCSTNTTYTTGSYWAYDVTSDATSLTVNITRAEYICAILVLEKDASVETVDYSINYNYQGNTIATDNGTEAVGTVINAASSKTVDGVKYLLDGGQTTSMTLVSGTNVLDVTVSVAPQFTCTVNAKANSTLLASPSKTVYSGESVTVYYQKGYNLDGTWYLVAPNSAYPSYGRTFSSVTSNSSYDLTTYAANENVVFYGEVENMNLSGKFAAEGGQTNRYSNGSAKRLFSDKDGSGNVRSTSYIYTDNIVAGVYTVTMWARNQSSSQAATLPLFLRDAEGNLTDLSVSFENWASSVQGEHVVLAHLQAACKLNCVFFREQRSFDRGEHRQRVGQGARASFRARQVVRR